MEIQGNIAQFGSVLEYFLGFEPIKPRKRLIEENTDRLPPFEKQIAESHLTIRNIWRRDDSGLKIIWALKCHKLLPCRKLGGGKVYVYDLFTDRYYDLAHVVKKSYRCVHHRLKTVPPDLIFAYDDCPNFRKRGWKKRNFAQLLCDADNASGGAA